MNKLYKIFLFGLLLTGCSTRDTGNNAFALLDEAREAVANNSFDQARKLIDSLRTTYPKEFDARRAALAFMDTVELQQAKQELRVSDSLLTYKQFELDDLKKNFTFEKQPKYQTTGYYVTNDYAGNKSAYNFYPEVEEGGTLLAVTINRSSGIKYNFSTVNIDFSSNNIPLCPISRSLSPKEHQSFEKCYRLAKCMQELTNAKSENERYNLKVRFFEKKILTSKSLSDKK